MSRLQPREGDCILYWVTMAIMILMLKSNVVGFVKAVIDYECLGCVFRFIIKEKDKDKFFIKIYSTIFLQICLFVCFFFNFLLLKLNNYKWYVCNLQLLLLMMNLLLTKFYNNYAIIYVQYSLKLFYIKYYTIIRASHK